MPKGSGYIGSDTLQTSTANQEVIPSPPDNWTSGYSLYKFSFRNLDDVTIVINGDTTLFRGAKEGFEMGVEDKPITSFVIKEAGVQYNWTGAY